MLAVAVAAMANCTGIFHPMKIMPILANGIRVKVLVSSFSKAINTVRFPRPTRG
jgi:hypothetical protein